jgi:23S rRNA pseudouridine955/2504/2580 synthase
MSNNDPIKVTIEETGQRLDKFIASRTENLSFVAIQKLLRTGQIRINGKRAVGKKRIETGNSIRIPSIFRNLKKSKFICYTELNDDLLNFVNNSILYKDKELIAVNKPAGLAVQGGSRIYDHVDGLLDYFRFESPYRPQLLHRIDKETSGVLLLSRKPDATRRLSEAFRSRNVKKVYWAFIIGHMPKTSGSINAPLGTVNSKNFERTAFDIDGKESKTIYNVFWKGNFKNIKLSLVEFLPETGRKHQIRAHCNHVGCSIIGDTKYISKTHRDMKNLYQFSFNMHLHAREIGVPDIEGITLRIKAPIPDHMLDIVEALKLSKDILN